VLAIEPFSVSHIECIIINLIRNDVLRLRVNWTDVHAQIGPRKENLNRVGANSCYLANCEDDTHIFLLSMFSMQTSFAFQWLESGGDILVGLNSSNPVDLGVARQSTMCDICTRPAKRHQRAIKHRNSIGWHTMAAPPRTGGEINDRH
jgi:hypothetical protein